MKQLGGFFHIHFLKSFYSHILLVYLYVDANCVVVDLFLIPHRRRGVTGKSQAVEGNKKTRTRDRVGLEVPAPEANAEIQSNLDVCSMLSFN